MADEEQLEILKSGVKGWNQWREENDELRIDLMDADLRGADLEGAQLQGVNLLHAKLQHANLRRAKLQLSRLHVADLQGADLQRANLDFSDLQYADLRGADLQYCRLWDANLREIRVSGANFNGAAFHDTVFAHVSELAQVQGLGACRHRGPSVLDTRTLESAQGQLPEVFLKGCGLKNWEILNAKLHDPNLRPDEIVDITYEVASLRAKGPIQVNSLFISYARKDSAFVDFIEKKLDNDGIRSWRDVHHMTAGPVEPQLERAIDLNGTVLLVLSENSLGSRWVEWEVEKADERQRELQAQGKDTHVLCPVAIDRTWEQSRWPGPLMNQIKKYNILDFSSWRRGGAEESYQKLKSGIVKYYAG